MKKVYNNVLSIIIFSLVIPITFKMRMMGTLLF